MLASPEVTGGRSMSSDATGLATTNGGRAPGAEVAEQERQFREILEFCPAAVCVVLPRFTVPTVASVSLFTPVIDVTVAVCGLPSYVTVYGATTTTALALLTV